LCEEKDGNLKRVGSLERDEPTLLSMKTLESTSRDARHPETEGHERRRGKGHAVAGEGKTLKGMKTQERNDSCSTV
jgi:hypothetical protein